MAIGEAMRAGGRLARVVETEREVEQRRQRLLRRPGKPVVELDGRTGVPAFVAFEGPRREDIDLRAGTPRPRAVVDEIAVERNDVRNGLSDEHAKGHGAYTPARISAAARSPERTAPSM